MWYKYVATVEGGRVNTGITAYGPQPAEDATTRWVRPGQTPATKPKDAVWEVRVDYDDNHSETVVVHAANRVVALRKAPRTRSVKLKTGFIRIEPFCVRVLRKRTTD